MGVNVTQLRAILTAKLMMDDRRPIHLNRKNSNKESKPSKYIWIGRFLLSGLLGIILIFPIISKANELVKMVMVFTLLLIILSAMLITEFTTVLLDAKDNQIILPKPVNDRTFLLSRILHLIIFILDLSIPISIPVMITLLIRNGISGMVAFMIIAPFAIIFTVFLLNIFYLFMLKNLSIQKFKSLVTYFQIFLAIIIYGGYQFIPRWMSSESYLSYKFSENLNSLLIPTYWFAAAWEIFLSGFTNAGLIRIAGALFAFLFPIISIWAMIVYFGPTFNRKLSSLSSSGTDPEYPSTIQSSLHLNKTKKRGKRIYQWLSEKLTQKGSEKMGFEFTWLLTARSRDFKLKTYPGIGYIVVYIVILLFSGRGLNFTKLALSESSKPILLISSLYITQFFMMGALANSKASDKYKAAWIFYISPIRFPGSIITGTVKSLLCKFSAPVILIITPIAFWLFGWRAIPNILFSIGNIVCLTYLTAYLAISEIPFSVPENAAGRGMTFIKNLLVGILPVGIGVFHYFIVSMIPLLILCCLLSFTAVWYLHSSLYQRHWQRFNPAYVESSEGI